MTNLKKFISLIFILTLAGIRCKEVYKPPATQNNPNLLVIDGIVISGNDSTIITLSRTRNLSDTAASVKEINAQVSVLGATGVEYPLTDMGNGRYAIDQLQLDTSQLYQLKVITFDGNEFRSDLNKVHVSPPIDSVYWNQDSVGVHVYLNTHDPTNNTRYYRWNYVETWEYRSAYTSFLQFVNGQAIFRPLTEQIYRCYQTQPSSTIEVTSTNRLSSDVVNKYEVTYVQTGSEKMSALYSDLVNQYAITSEAYDFWQNLKKNTEQLGSLFDLQPFTELGNIHCVNNPAVKCIGYISFSTLQQKRIFVDKNNIYNWKYLPYYGQCYIDTIPPTDLYKYFPPPDGSAFYTLIGTDNGAYLFSTNLCVDCAYHGGSIIKPPYWP